MSYKEINDIENVKFVPFEVGGMGGVAVAQHPTKETQAGVGRWLASNGKTRLTVPEAQYLKRCYVQAGKKAPRCVEEALQGNGYKRTQETRWSVFPVGPKKETQLFKDAWPKLWPTVDLKSQQLMAEITLRYIGTKAGSEKRALVVAEARDLAKRMREASSMGVFEVPVPAESEADGQADSDEASLSGFAAAPAKKAKVGKTRVKVEGEAKKPPPLASAPSEAELALQAKVESLQGIVKKQGTCLNSILGGEEIGKAGTAAEAAGVRAAWQGNSPYGDVVEISRAEYERQRAARAGSVSGGGLQGTAGEAGSVVVVVPRGAGVGAAGSAGAIPVVAPPRVDGEGAGSGPAGSGNGGSEDAAPAAARSLWFWK